MTPMIKFYVFFKWSLVCILTINSMSHSEGSIEGIADHKTNYVYVKFQFFSTTIQILDPKPKEIKCH